MVFLYIIVFFSFFFIENHFRFLIVLFFFQYQPRIGIIYLPISILFLEEKKKVYYALNQKKERKYANSSFVTVFAMHVYNDFTIQV